MLTRSLITAMVCATLSACDSATGPDAIPTIPEPPAGFLKFVAIDAGGGTVCAITADSLTYCWGKPLVGVNYEYAPKWVSSVEKLGTIAVGEHSNFGATAMLCGTKESTEIVCYGEAGWPSTVVTVPGSAGFTSVSVGSAICAIATDATGRCWRYNLTNDALGVAPGGTITAGSPVTVAGGRQYQSMSVGGLTACAVTTGGEVDCWGNNFALQVPDDPASLLVFEPTRVTLPVPASRVSTLELHACAIGSGALDGAYCWGMTARGRLGQTNPETVECPNVIDGNTAQPARCVEQPIAVSGNPAFVTIAAGTHHTCALDATGQAYCWGSGTWGEIGNGRRDVSNWKATPTPVAGNLRFRAITAGGFFTCGIATNDATYCWGSNFGGMLGANEDLAFVATVPHPIALPQ